MQEIPQHFPPKRFFILYGSQTGISESIAKRLQEESLERGYKSHFDRLSNFRKINLFDHKEATLCVIVCSTTGNGDPPENAELFYRFIRRKSHPETMASNIEYMVLALGDSNYDKFCQCGKDISKRLEQLGAKKLIPIEMADDATGLEETVEPWIMKMWSVVQNRFAPSSTSNDTKTTISSTNGAVTTTNISTLVSNSSISPLLPSSSSLSSSSSLLDKKSEKTEQYDSNNDTSTRYESFIGISCFVKSKIIHNPNSNSATMRQIPNGIEASPHYDEYNPYYAKMIGARYLTTDNSIEKQVLHIELDLGKSHMTFLPGNAIGIKCSNTTPLILQLMKHIKIPAVASNDTSNLYMDLKSMNDEQLLETAKKIYIESLECTDPSKESVMPTHIKTPASLYEILKKQIDIASIQVNILQLRTLSQYCTDEQEKQEMQLLVSKPQNFRVTIIQQKANLLDIFRWFPSCHITLDHLLQICYKLQPRYYSISNSPFRHNNQVHIAFSTVQYVTPPPYRLTKQGLCTVHYLLPKVKKFLLSESEVSVPIFMKKSAEFILPELTNQQQIRPIIMIGPGTGIAPFRGFIQHRLFMNPKSQVSQGKDPEVNELLFHGCRRMDHDFLYRDELMPLHSKKLIHCVVACSREATGGLWYGGVYVQDMMREYGAEIINIMQKRGGYLYVCGDAQSMAKQVRKVLVAICSEELNMSIAEAESLVLQWEKSKRYQQDVWS